MGGPYRFMLGADAIAGQMLVVDPNTGKLVPHSGDYGPEAWRLAVDGRAGDWLVWDAFHGYVYPDTLAGRFAQSAAHADEYTFPQRFVIGGPSTTTPKETHPMIDSILFSSDDDDAIPPTELMRVGLVVQPDNPEDAALFFRFERYSETTDDSTMETIGSCTVNLHTFRDALRVLERDEMPVPESPLMRLLREAFKSKAPKSGATGPDYAGAADWQVGDQVTVTPVTGEDGERAGYAVTPTPGGTQGDVDAEPGEGSDG